MEKEKSEEEILEESINKKALKLGKKVLSEIYLHGEDKIEVSIGKSELFDWSVVEVGVHKVTGLLENEIEFIKREGLRERGLNDYEIKDKVIKEK